MKKKSKTIYWIVGILILMIAGGIGFFGVYPTKDTIAIPGNFYIQNTGTAVNAPTQACLSFNLGGVGVNYGGCVDIPGCSLSGNPMATQLCKANGFIDRGCGWDADTSCVCNSCQVGCFGEKSYYPSNIKIKCNNKDISSSCSGNSCKTINFADLFPSNLPKDWTMSCSVECDGRGQFTSVDFKQSGCEKPPCENCNPSLWWVALAIIVMGIIGYIIYRRATR